MNSFWEEGEFLVGKTPHYASFRETGEFLSPPVKDFLEFV
jgi:hypothetical protein